ncbi:MAG: GNAT family N-acetyltransferase [Anaerolineales bacterium]
MNDVVIRTATLDDVAAVTGIHCSTVERWREPRTGRGVPYEALDLYGRWRNGGPWMSRETCAVHLNALLQEGHLPLVAEIAGEVVAEAEYYIDREPQPFAALHLSVLYVHANRQGRGLGRRLVDAGKREARARHLPALTTQPEDATGPFYARLGFSLWRRAQELQLSTRGSAPPPPARRWERDTGSPREIALRIGRYQCGEQGWIALWPTLFLPGWSDLRRWVWEVDLEGGRALLGLREQLTDPHQADAYAWLPPEAPLAPAVAALQSLGAAQGFSAIDLLLPNAALPELRRAFRLDHQTYVDLWQLPLAEG